MNTEFAEALQSSSLERMRSIPKSDLHSHAGRGGSKSYIETWANVEILSPVKPFDSLDEMNQWLNDHIKPYCPGLAGYLKRVEAAFAQAKYDTIRVLALSFGIGDIDFLGSLDVFIDSISQLHRLFAPHTEFCPDLTLGYDKNSEPGRLDEIFSRHWFRGIDICNYMHTYTLEELKPLCRKARDSGLLLKAHVGEFGEADDVFRYAEKLGLDEIQHGIAAASSPQVMKWLADNKIRLNVCPTSNILLKNAESYKTHPIRTLLDNGVPVTINTDDLIIFNSTVSEEFLHLYTSGLMNAKELDVIRETGLDHQYRSA